MSVGRNDPCPCGSGKKYKACCQERDRARAMMASVVGEEAFAAAEAEWNEIARGAEVWEADVANLPIGMGDSPDAAPALALVVGGGFTVHGGVVPSRPKSAAERARAVAEAVEAAKRVVGTLPPRIRVREAAVAASLEALLAPKGIATEAGPVPELDEALADSLAHLTGSPVMGRLSTPASWAETEASAEALAAFHAAAAEFYRAAPWDALGEDPLLLAFPDGSEWGAALMGGGGEQFGLVLYSHPDDLLDLYDDGGEDPEAHFAGMRGCTLTADFDRRSELTKAMRREVDDAKWPIAGPAAWPRIFGMKLPEWRVTAAHVERMTRALRAVTLAAADADPEPVTGIRVALLDAGPVIAWPAPDEAAPATAEGPGADPEAALRGWEAMDEVARVEEARLTRLEEWLAFSDDVLPESMEADAENARIWTDYLCASALPAGAVTELDLRDFLFGYYPSLPEVPRETADSLPRGLSLVFRFLEEPEGIRYPFAARVLDEVAEVAAREGMSVAEVLDHGGRGLYGQLEDRELVPEQEIPGVDGGWPERMDPRVAVLNHELERRWLLWRDEAVRAGTVDLDALHEVLVARQRAWETAPHPRLGGLTPVDAVRANQPADEEEEDPDR